MHVLLIKLSLLSKTTQIMGNFDWELNLISISALPFFIVESPHKFFVYVVFPQTKADIVILAMQNYNID